MLNGFIDYLVSIFPAGELFASRFPENVDSGNLFRILPSSSTVNNLAQLDHMQVNFSITSCGADDLEAAGLAEAAFDLLNHIDDESYASGRVISMVAVGVPAYGFIDENDRVNYVCNYTAYIE